MQHVRSFQSVFLLFSLAIFCAAAVIASPAQTLTTLHSFDSTDGANPFAGLFQASDGNFYGTTYNGGANNEGTVFKITPSGTLVWVYSFCSQPNCTDGALPVGGLIQYSDGNLYGTAGRSATKVWLPFLMKLSGTGPQDNGSPSALQPTATSADGSTASPCARLWRFARATRRPTGT